VIEKILEGITGKLAQREEKMVKTFVIFVLKNDLKEQRKARII
jgi:hypothetical protein